jgi:hypothetical protein
MLTADKATELGAKVSRLVSRIETMPDGAEKIDLKAIICTLLPIYNGVAVIVGWPVFPLPEFCNV